MAEIEQWLLTTRSDPSPNVEYTNFNETYGTVTPLATMGQYQLIYENAHILYMCVPDVINAPSSYKWRFYRCSMKSGEIEYICDITSNGPNISNTAQPFGIICDDLYIYWINKESSNHILYRLNIDTHVVESVYTGNGDPLANIFFISNNKICIITSGIFTLFDTETLLVKTVSSTGLSSKQYSICKGNNLIVAVDTNVLYWYDLTTYTNGTKTLSSSRKSSCCYDNGKFYIVQDTYLYEFDEATKVISNAEGHYLEGAPWGTYPLSINVCNGLLYIVLSLYEYVHNASTKTKSLNEVFIVDQHDFSKYNRTAYGFLINGNDISTTSFQQNNTTTYGDMFFLLKDRLCMIEYNPNIKYNIGMKRDYLGKDCNSTTKDEFTYNPSIISFNSTYMTIKDFLIPKEITLYDTDIKKISVNKNEYFKIKRIIQN